MRLDWRPQALIDRREIMDYIADDNIEAAIKLDIDIEGCAERIREGGLLHKPGRLEGTREALVRNNYCLVYRYTDAVVTVLRVVHTSRQWPG